MEERYPGKVEVVGLSPAEYNNFYQLVNSYYLTNF